MKEFLKRYPCLSASETALEEAVHLITDTYKKGGKLLLCGNGGSEADCDHIVGELMKGFLLPREVNDLRIPEALRPCLQGALPAISLPAMTAALTAFMNDVSPSMVYAQLLYGYAKENDLLVAISTSGNSENVVNAARVAKAIGVRVLSLTGEKESLLSALSDVSIRVPETETYKVQELHLPVYHYLCAAVEKHFFGK